ncbi:DUF1490 family protein [Streptomyces sp. NPDC055036]
MYGAALGWLGHHTVSGVFGALVTDGALKAAPQVKPVARKAVVDGLADGIAAGRWLTSVAQEARVTAGNVVADAQAQLGEEASGPGAKVKWRGIRARRLLGRER